MPQNDDGTPHIAYYDKAHELSFVWDGRSETVDVCAGGYGEPVSDTIDLTLYHPSMFRSEESDNAKALRLLSDMEDAPLVQQIHDWLQWFKTICQLHIELYYEEGGRGYQG